MPDIGKTTLRFKPPAVTPRNADIRGYYLRIKLDGGAGSASSYALPRIDLSKPGANAQGFVQVDLGAIPAVAGLDGVYDLSVTAYDDADNESDFLAIENAVVDFLAPEAPTDGSVA